MPPPSTPTERVQIRISPSASASDLMFYETHDGTYARNNNFVYGTAHPDSSRFPSHILVYCEPEDPKGMRKWYYAAKRENQDEYNFEWVDADYQGTKFEFVTRSYVTLRSEYSATTPAHGATMMNVPAGKFSNYASFILGARQETRIGQKELDSMFVAETMIYIKRVTIGEVNTDPALGVGVSKTLTWYYRGESVGGSTIEALIAAPENAYWGIQSDGTSRQGQQISDNWFIVSTTSSKDAALLADKRVIPGITDIPDFPEVLEAITVVWNSASGTGSFSSDYSGVAKWAGDIQVSLSGGESANAQGSASIQPELSITFGSKTGKNVHCIQYFFNMKLTSGVITLANLLARLTELAGAAVSSWPTFKPETHIITLLGQKVSVASQASANGSVSASESSGYISRDLTEGTGEDYDVSTMNGTKTIGPVIHGVISIGADGGTVAGGKITKTAAASATCTVGWTSSTTNTYLGELVEIPDTTITPIVALEYATATVSPASLSATAGQSTIPTSGLYLMPGFKIQPYTSDPAWVKIFAEVVNASDI